MSNAKDSANDGKKSKKELSEEAKMKQELCEQKKELIKLYSCASFIKTIYKLSVLNYTKDIVDSDHEDDWRSINSTGNLYAMQNISFKSTRTSDNPDTAKQTSRKKRKMSKKERAEFKKKFSFLGDSEDEEEDIWSMLSAPENDSATQNFANNSGKNTKTTGKKAKKKTANQKSSGPKPSNLIDRKPETSENSFSTQNGTLTKWQNIQIEPAEDRRWKLYIVDNNVTSDDDQIEINVADIPKCESTRFIEILLGEEEVVPKKPSSLQNIEKSLKHIFLPVGLEQFDTNSMDLTKMDLEIDQEKTAEFRESIFEAFNIMRQFQIRLFGRIIPVLYVPEYFDRKNPYQLPKGKPDENRRKNVIIPLEAGLAAIFPGVYLETRIESINYSNPIMFELIGVINLIIQKLRISTLINFDLFAFHLNSLEFSLPKPAPFPYTFRQMLKGSDLELIEPDVIDYVDSFGHVAASEFVSSEYIQDRFEKKKRIRIEDMYYYYLNWDMIKLKLYSFD